MKHVTLAIPRINDYDPYWDRLLALWQRVNDDDLDVTFEFSTCDFFRQNGVAFIGGLARLIESRGGRVTFDWSSLRDKVALNLAKNGLRDAFGDQTTIGVGNSIPYREDAFVDKVGIIQYLKRLWLGRGWVNVSPTARDLIVGQVWEIYANAFEHSESAVGVFSCGQHFPRLNVLALTVVDFGTGIPANVRRFVRNESCSARAAMQWAFQQGTTTKASGFGRGLGLDLLKQFVKLNHGKLEVFSHEGHAIIDAEHEVYVNRPVWFEGTLVNVSLKCDDKFYCMASELPPVEPLF